MKHSTRGLTTCYTHLAGLLLGSNICTVFQMNPLKPVGGVDKINSIPCATVY